jgi:hypothetical protein
LNHCCPPIQSNTATNNRSGKTLAAIKIMNELTIQLLSYDRPTSITERYYFLEMSTLQITKTIADERKIRKLKILAFDLDDEILDTQIDESLKTIHDFNSFFSERSEFFIHDCEIELDDNLKVSSHDDGEVSIAMPLDSKDNVLIDQIFQAFNLNKNLISVIKSKPGHYFSINKEGRIFEDFKDFDDYIAHGRD